MQFILHRWFRPSFQTCERRAAATIGGIELENK